MTFPTIFPEPVRLRGYTLRVKLASFGFVRANVGFQTSTLSDVAGLAVQLEPHARYAIDGYVAYLTSATADIKFTIAAPDGATGHWGMYPQTQAATGSIGDLEALRLDEFTDAEQQGAAGSASFSSALLCIPHGYVQTNLYGGAFQVRFAQVATTATATQVVAGSWIRATEISKVAL